MTFVLIGALRVKVRSVQCSISCELRIIRYFLPVGVFYEPVFGFLPNF